MTIVQRVRKLLALARDLQGEQLRDAMERAGELLRDYWGDAYVAQMAPVAWRTWESTTTIAGAAPESPGANLEYPHPVEVVGMYPVVVVAAPNAPAPGFVVPTLDDLLVSVNWDQEQQATANQDQTAQSGRSSFVTASSLSVLVPRLWAIRLESPKPVMNFTWRWKQGVGIFQDSIVSVATFVRPIPKRS